MGKIHLKNEYGLVCSDGAYVSKIIHQTIANGHIWEKGTQDFIIKNHNNKDVIHAGAFIGDMFPAVSKNMNQEAILWAFEPTPLAYECAVETIKINDLNNVKLYNYALGDKNSHINLYLEIEGRICGGGAVVDEIYEGKGSLPKQHWSKPVGTTVEVEVKKLDDIIPQDREVSIIHLDIEYYEEIALNGAKQIIEKYKPILILEGQPELNEFLYGLGYTLSGEIEHNHIWAVEPKEI